MFAKYGDMRAGLIALAASCLLSCGAGDDALSGSAAAEPLGQSQSELFDGQWAQEAYAKASNTEAYDGWIRPSVAVSDNGLYMAVGYASDDSNSALNPADNSISASGAVHVYVKSGEVWSHQAYLKASNPGELDQFGYSLALSSDGTTLAVGAYQEDSNGTQSDNSRMDSGAVYVFTRSGAS